MNDLGQSLVFAASGMRAQATRLRVTSENIANTDTPGFHRKVLTFRNALDGNGVEVGPVRLDPRELRQIYDPSHPLADESGHYMGSNVDLLVEIADAREAQRSYEANLKMFDQTRQMSRALMEVLRR